MLLEFFRVGILLVEWLCWLVWVWGYGGGATCFFYVFGDLLGDICPLVYKLVAIGHLLSDH